MTMLLGVLIFIDDYFNCLTVGAVMRPVTESHHISRAKLAYVIDCYRRSRLHDRSRVLLGCRRVRLRQFRVLSAVLRCSSSRSPGTTTA